jgi:hypothetical protein
MPFPSKFKFEEADLKQSVKRFIPTTLKHRELSLISAELRERGIFSATTYQTSHLQEIQKQVDKLIAGDTDTATARLALKDSLDALGYRPEPDKVGTIEDLRSDPRLDLIIRTNVEQATGYGQWQQGQDQSILDAWPAQELVRWEPRDKKRDWKQRWIDAGGQVFEGEGLDGPGRLVALKDSPVWSKLSIFGTPYPPFDFNSGVGVEDVTRGDAIDLGLMEPSDVIQPEDRGFNEDLKTETHALTKDWKKAILTSLEWQYEFNGNTLTRKGWN